MAIEAGAVIEGSTITNSIVFGEARVSDSTLDDSVVGRHAEIRGFSGTLNIGDHATVG